jgi:hypothetical protein
MEFMDLTSLTLNDFQHLVLPFEAAFQVQMTDKRLDGKPRIARRFSVDKNCTLPTPEERLNQASQYWATSGSVRCAHDCPVAASFRAHSARYPEVGGAMRVRISCGLIECHTVKNVLLSNAPFAILFLREIATGSGCDQRLADATPYPLPAGSRLWQDLECLGCTLTRATARIMIEVHDPTFLRGAFMAHSHFVIDS